MISGARVVKVALASVASVAPLTARAPAGTVTANVLAAGNLGSVVVNVSSWVSIQRQLPVTAGVIRAGGRWTTPTAATGTIGSSKRMRTSDVTPVFPSGVICGDASGAMGFGGRGGAGAGRPSATDFPVGTTNAIGWSLPGRDGAADAGRRTGAAAFVFARSGSGSSRLISATV